MIKCRMRRGLKAFFLTLAALLVSERLPAQAFRVTGRVTGPSGEGEIGAFVCLKGASGVGALTDAEGSYSLELPSDAGVLRISMLGYVTQEIPVEGRRVINVRLEEDVALLEEVVVIGYGTQQKQFLVGSVSSASSRELLKAPINDVQSMLTGRLAGMTNIQKTGTPGEGNSLLLVRGYTSFNNSSPLVIVDGVPRPMNYVNPADIASVSVLKDAATAAIYGVRGANGVILITTKSGAEGRAHISYNGSLTFTTNTAEPDLLDADEYIYWHNKGRELDGQTPYYTEENLRKMEEMGVLGETDWFDEIFKPCGLTRRHNLSASGGTQRLRYYASLGYMDEDGILKHTDFCRYNIRTSVEAELANNLRFSINMAGTHSQRDWPGLPIRLQSEFSPITQAIYGVPCLKKEYDGLPLGFTNGVYTFNAEAALDTGYQQQSRWIGEMSSRLEYDFGGFKALQGLKAALFFGFDYNHTGDRNLLETYQLYRFDPEAMAVQQMTSLGIADTNFNRSSSMGWNMVLRPSLSYEREFQGRHRLSGLFLFERTSHYGETMTGYKKGFFSTDIVDITMGAEQQVPYVSGGHDHSGMASFAGRLGYAFARKYLVELTLRADGSYKFAPRYRWGYFPSVATGWVLSEEDWFKAEQVDFLKLRASFGILGNDDLSPYTYLPTYRTTGSALIYAWDQHARPAFYSTGYVHEDLTWSRTNTVNFGADFRAFRNRLSIEADVFYKYTSRILENESSASTYAPSLGGYNPIWLNSGRMENGGFDMTLGWTDAFAGGWSYSLKGTLGWARNRILSKKIADNHPSYRAVLGQPIGVKYGYHALGLFQTQEQLDEYPVAPSGHIELGALRYEDVNGDGKIDPAHDYVKIGRSSVPEMTFSLNAEAGWKAFSLSMLFQGAALCSYTLNGEYMNGNTDGTMFTRQFYGGGNALRHLVEGSWRPDHTDAEYPRLRASGNANNAWSSSWWVKDGSYLRLKNLQLSYTLPKEVFRPGRGLDRLRVYFAGTNLFTLSAFKYLDPENPGINNGYYPQQRTFSMGLDITF